MRWPIAASAAFLLAGCVTTPTGLPPVSVFASGETEPVGTANEDAADDPAIWHNEANPEASLIVATDKKAGLYVYGLDGSIRSFLDVGLVNNVDLLTLPDGTILVGASDRNDPLQAHTVLMTLDPQTAELTQVSRFHVGAGEGYGFCMALNADQGMVNIYSPLKEGDVYLSTLQISAGLDSAVGNTLLHTLPSQPEGCVYDERTDYLYVGEEVGGIWLFDFATDQTENNPRIVAPVDNQYLVADVEGLALAPEGETGGYLIASSQGDNAYAVFSLPDMTPVGRFAIAQGAFGSTEETDGIGLVTADFGADYPEGIFIAQDGVNEAGAQNFKLVSWAHIRAALGL